MSGALGVYPAPPDVRVSRFQSAGLETALEQFTNAELLAAGEVTVIDLDAVVKRFGERWAIRREQVHEHVEAALDRHLGPTAFSLRISDTDVLICQPGQGRLAGQALCLRALREILTHFLGGDESAAASVHEVVGVSPNGLEARRIDVHAAAAELERVQAESRSRPAPGGLGGSVDRWTPFVTVDGVAVDVTACLEPVFQLRDRRPIGPRLSHTIRYVNSGRELRSHELARLAGSDLLRIGTAGLHRGLEALGAAVKSPTPTVIVPINVSSLATTNGRAGIVEGLKKARAHVTCGVICELEGLEGVPQARLTEAIAVVRPFSVLVVGHLADLSIATARPLGGLTLNAVSTRAPSELEGAALAARIAMALRGAKHIGNSALLYGLASDTSARIAHSLGATHASITKRRVE